MGKIPCDQGRLTHWFKFQLNTGVCGKEEKKSGLVFEGMVKTLLKNSEGKISKI